MIEEYDEWGFKAYDKRKKYTNPAAKSELDEMLIGLIRNMANIPDGEITLKEHAGEILKEFIDHDLRYFKSSKNVRGFPDGTLHDLSWLAEVYR